MTPEEVKQIIGDVPNMTLDQGMAITELIRAQGSRQILELGFAYGVSTCYLAAALQGIPGARVTTIDLEAARNNCPNIESLLRMCGLTNMVSIYYEPTSYLWRLMKFIEEDPSRTFDLCYVDGSHTWCVDGFAFFLADRLIRPGGWFIFDDLDWTYALSPTLAHTEGVRRLPAEERETPQIRKVFELLVMRHPCYGDFEIRNGWGYAHKFNAIRLPRLVEKILRFYSPGMYKLLMK
jgi:predicted O-methyltransferase YrrM